MLFTSQGGTAAGVKRGRTQGPPYTARRGAGFFGVARVSGGVIERCEGEGLQGLCHRVTPMRSDIAFKQKTAFFSLVANRQGL